jgi:DNA-binding PadR family transcriptional regulator
MSLRHALLGALADRPRTGYALLKHFEQSLAYAWPASHSQIYPELARLRGDGLIEQTGSGARNSKTYAVTDAGLAEVRRWLRETDPDRRVRSDAALRTFFLWLLEPAEARTELERERSYWHERLLELEAIKSQPRGPGRKEQAFGIALEGGIRSIETRLEWLNWAERELERDPTSA